MAVGNSHIATARILGISPNTLEKMYRQELDHGVEDLNKIVVNSLFKIATGNTPSAAAACIFWLKVRAGWSERTKVDVSIEHKSDAELMRIIQDNLPQYQTMLEGDNPLISHDNLPFINGTAEVIPEPVPPIDPARR
jgi:hypothetical protein